MSYVAVAPSVPGMAIFIRITWQSRSLSTFTASFALEKAPTHCSPSVSCSRRYKLPKVGIIFEYGYVYDGFFGQRCKANRAFTIPNSGDILVVALSPYWG
jgi:hypothetical protein